MTDLLSPATGSESTLADRVRRDFPILERRFVGKQLVYLDNAATAQKPKAVLDALVDFYSNINSNVGRGYYRLSMAATEAYESARATVAAALGAAHPDEVVFTAGTTDSINLLARTFGRSVLGRGDQVLVSILEHNSNQLPWRELCAEAGAELVVLPADEHGRLTPETFAAALGPRVKLAALTQVSNVLGTVNPVRELIALAHRHGVPVVVDGAQAVPHRPVDVRELDADFYAFSGHKVYGPMGIGVLYGKRELLHPLPPYRVGGGTVKAVSLTEPVRYVPAPARQEAGTPDVAGAVGLATALDYLGGLGWPAIRAHDAHLVRAAVEGLGEVPGVRVLGDPAADPGGIVSFVVEGIHCYDVGGHLDAHGVAVRSGVHCANPLLDRLGEVGAVRLSFGVYNTEREIDLVCRALRTVRPGTWTTEHPDARFL